MFADMTVIDLEEFKLERGYMMKMKMNMKGDRHAMLEVHTTASEQDE